MKVQLSPSSFKRFLSRKFAVILGVAASGIIGLVAFAQLPTATTGVATFFVQVSADSTGYPGSTTAFVPGDFPHWQGTYAPPVLDGPQWKENQIDFPVSQPYRRGQTHYPFGYVPSYLVGNAWTNVEPADNTAIKGIRFRYDPVTSVLQPPPATSVNFTGGGDGYEVIPYQGKLYVVNHHETGKVLKCFDAVTAKMCDGWQGGQSIRQGSYTSNQPVHYLNRTNGNLYFPVENSGDLAFECFNLLTQSFCGSLRFAGGTGYGDVIGLGVVNDRLYAVARTGEVGCINGLTGKACSATRNGTYSLPSFAGDQIGGGAVSDRYLFVYDRNDNLHCFDDTTASQCAGNWPVQISFQGMRVITNATGAFKAICTQSTQCFDASGASYTLSGNEVGLESGWPTMGAYTRGITYKQKVFGWLGDVINCHDLATGSSCAGFPYTATDGLRNYTIIADPERPDCMWTNSDSGTARSFSAMTGGQCPGYGGTPVTLIAKPGTAYQCQPTGVNPTWKSIVLSAPASGTVTAKIYNNTNGNLISERSFAPGASSISISDIAYASYPELKVDLTLGTSGNGQTVSADILWDGPPPQFCVQTKTTNASCVVSADWSSKSGLPGNSTPNYSVSITGKGLSSGAPLQGYNAAAASSSTELADSPLLFKGRFDERTLTGDLWLTRLEAATGVEMVDAAGAPKVLAMASAAGVIPGAAARRVLTQLPDVSGVSGLTAPFRWTSLHASQQLLLNKNLSNTIDSLGSKRVDYLRGSNADEAPAFGTVPSGKLRKRAGPLGMVLGSGMVYVPKQMVQGISEANAPGLESYVLNPQRALNMVFFAANDGMLHGMTVSDGGGASVTLSEQFAYMPRRLLGLINRYTDSTPFQLWSNPYFHDNTPMVNDLSRNGAWSTVLVSTFGRGAPGLVALDISRGDAITEGTSNVVIREFTDQDDADMGHIISQPALNQLGYATQIVQVKRAGTTRPAVIVGNGVNSSNAKAALFIVYLDSTGGYDKLVLPGDNNGLSTPRVVDLNGDGVIDRVYAGDLLGNVWSIEMGDTAAMTSRRLFTASAPIASAPVVKPFSPVGLCYRCMMVNVVTGTPTAGPILYDYTGATQFVYGLWDKNEAQPIADADLVDQSLLPDATGVYTVNNRLVGYSTLANSKRGWRMALPAGHMAVANPYYRANGTLMFSTVAPPSVSGNSCVTGKSLIVAIDSATGNRANLGFSGHPTWSATLASTLVFGAQPLISGGSTAGAGGKDLVVNPDGRSAAFVPRVTTSNRLSWQEIDR